MLSAGLVNVRDLADAKQWGSQLCVQRHLQEHSRRSEMKQATWLSPVCWVSGRMLSMQFSTRKFPWRSDSNPLITSRQIHAGSRAYRASRHRLRPEPGTGTTRLPLFTVHCNVCASQYLGSHLGLSGAVRGDCLHCGVFAFRTKISIGQGTAVDSDGCGMKWPLHCWEDGTACVVASSWGDCEERVNRWEAEHPFVC